jgi:serine/threonine-protein kinase
VERESYALQIGAAQEWLRKGRLDNAVKMFKEAFKNGGTGVARSLLAHAAVAKEEAKTNHCKVTGLGRPREFEATSQSSRPTLAVTSTGTILVWVDNHHDSTKRQGVSTRLDSCLRRVAPTLVVTPETDNASTVQLTPAGENLVLTYSVRGRTDPGGYVRLLGENGKIASKARRIAEVTQHRITPMLAPTSSGSYWVVWEDSFRKGTRDLVARHLNADLEPIADPVRLTAYAPVKRGTNGVSSPSVAVAHQHLYVPYVVTSGKKSQLFVQRIGLSDPLLKQGLPKTEKELKKAQLASKGGDKDLFVGSVQPLGAERGKNAEPQVTCVAEGCYVVWDDERGGALVAFIDQEKGEALWHREIAARGARPNVAASEARTVVAWYEGGRLKLADLTRDGLGKVSVLARVTGYQPHPDVVAGREAGEWLIAWRDYEAGHLETYVVRAECP